MSENIFKIDLNHAELFGELIVKWSNGDIAKPNNYDELLVQLDDEGIEYTKPDSGLPKLQLQLIPMADNVLTITIPTPLMIGNAIEKANSETGTYPLPLAYDLVFDTPLRKPGDELSPADRKTILMARIGDYSVSHCQ